MIFLHVGRHKTGTSSIQHFMHANREALASGGVLYPEPLECIAAHHGIVLAIEQGRDLEPYRVLLSDWLRTGKRVVVSSEGFQRIRPHLLHDWIGETRPHVVVYIREQFSYGWAAYAQKVCANFESRTFEAARAGWNPDYHAFLKRWQAISDGITVRIYDRSRLTDGDVVADFVQALDLPSDKLTYSDEQVNPTPGWRLVEFNRRINSHIAGMPDAKRARTLLRRGTWKIATSFPDLREKPIFPENIVAEYQSRYSDSNKRVFAEFFGSDDNLFNMTWRGDSEPEDGVMLRPDHIEALYEAVPALKDELGDTIRATNQNSPP